MGRGGDGGEAESEGWSRGSDDASDVKTEEEGWGHTPLTALPWGMQESGARGLRMDARAGGSDGRKASSATADEVETQGCHGARREQGAKKGGQQRCEKAETRGVGGNSGGCEASGVTPR